MKTFSIFPIRYGKASSINLAGDTRLLSFMFLAICLLCVSATALAQTQLGADINGELAEYESAVSVSLSADGNRLAVGARNNDGNGSRSGHVRVHQWSGTAWAQLGADIDGEAAENLSGESVSLSSAGDRVAIGAVFNNGNGEHSGHVRTYQWSGTVWVQLGADIDGEAAGDYSGASVSLSSDGDRVAIGATRNDANGTYSGHVRVYQWSGTAWTQLGADIDGVAEHDQFGESVSLSSDGSRLVIGASRSDVNGRRSGQVRVFQWSGTAWAQLGANIDGKVDYDYLGNSVSLSADGSRLAIGAWSTNYRDGAGRVEVYHWSGVTWEQLGSDIEGEADGDGSGLSISLSSDGNRLAIGAPYNGDNVAYSSQTNAYLGNSSKVLADTDNSGQVRIYQWSGSDWVQLGSDIDGYPNDGFGQSVALSSDGNRVASGTGNNMAVFERANRVRVYDLSMLNTFRINPGLNDAWYDPDTDGQGFFITVFPDLGAVSLAWFTYDTELPPLDATANLGDPGHRWLTAVGPIVDNQAMMEIEMTSGGIFDSASEIIRTDPPGSDGTIILTFDNCNAGTIEYDIPSINRQGIVPIRRVANDNIVICEALSTN